MNTLFMMSYALLGGLVVLQAIVLNWILREILGYRLLYLSRLDKVKELIRNGELNRLPQGVAAPEFTAPLLSTGELINTSNIKGHDSILLFVAPDKPSPYYQHLPAVTHALWHETDGHLYIICNGQEESCRTFVNEHLVEGMPRHTIPVILDEEGSIARSYLVKKFPRAVSLDEELRVFRYGEPIPGEEAAPEADRPQPDSELSEPAINDRPCDWPDSHPTTGATFARVDTKVSCVLTRFRLRSAWSLIPFYLAFRRVRRESREVGGLLQSLFLIEDWRTCYTLSMWANDCAIVDFGRVRAHIDAANSAFGPTYRRDMQRSEIWSAQFRLWAVSSHNMNWDGFDLQPILGDQWERRKSAPLKKYLLLPRMNANIHE